MTTRKLIAQNPNPSWSEGQLLDYLKRASSIAPSGESNRQVTRALDALLRKKLRNHSRIMGVMLAISKDRGLMNPISSMVSKLMLSSIERRPANLDLFEIELQKKQPDPFLLTASIVINKLPPEKQGQFMPSIFFQLTTRDKIDEISYELLELLEPSSKGMKEVSAHLGKYLDSDEDQRVIFGVQIATRVGGRRLTPRLVRIMERLEDGWYQTLGAEIRKEASRFFQRHPDNRAKEHLLRLLRSSPSDAVAEALASYNTRARYTLK